MEEQRDQDQRDQDRDQEVERLQGAGGADRKRVLGDLFDDQRGRLRRMVELRMDARLRERVDASDVIQEAWLEISARLEDYLRDPRMPFHLWVRFITGQKLLALYRHHIGTQKRDARRQRSLSPQVGPEASSVAIAEHVLQASGTTPTGFAVKQELRSQLVGALDAMDPIDREVLVLRHVEQLGNSDVAAVLGIGKTAASNRYVRALDRLRSLLTGGSPSESSGDSEP